MDKNNLDKINSFFEIGIDEVGRGPLFGRIYASAIILPQSDENFNFTIIKDSKKFSSFKKLKEVSEYLKKNAIDYGIGYCDEKEIDIKNIREATFIAMHRSINNLQILKDKNNLSKIILLIDGNCFKPYTILDKNNNLIELKSNCLIKGDQINKTIAAASIIAKIERDEYIYDLCSKIPILDHYYQLSKNKGYGTKAHLEGIKKYGITQFHRKSFNMPNKNLNNI